MNSKKPHYFSTFKISEVLNNGGLIFLFTLMTYYFVAKSVEISYVAMKIPTHFIEYPFYNLVKAVDFPLTVFFPLLFFIVFFFFMLYERYKLNNAHKYEPSIIDRLNFLRGRNLKREKSVARKTRLYFFTFLILILLYFSSRNPKYYLHFMSQTIMTTAVIIGLYLLYRLLFFNKTPFTTKVSRMYEVAMLTFVSVALYGNFLIFILVANESSQPYQLIVSDEHTEFEIFESHNIYRFEYLISEKEGYGVWAKAFLFAPNKGENGISYIYNDGFITREMKDVEFKEVEVQRTFRLISIDQQREDDNGFRTYLYLDGFSEYSKLVNLKTLIELNGSLNSK